MTLFIASDVHLRSDRPDRARRFHHWVSRLPGEARLILLGDLCDFWMGSRQTERQMLESEGLRALTDYRARGGDLSILPGNHDLWLCDFYERELGATILPDPTDLTIHGLRLHLVHGHLLGARKKWKAWMEGREFFKLFGHLPTPLAGVLDQSLERKNHRDLLSDEGRHMAVYRAYADSRRGEADLVVTGHVHRPLDDPAGDPRMIVVGGWQTRSSYLRIDPSGATFQVVDDGEPFPDLDPVSGDPIPVEPRSETS